MLEQKVDLGFLPTPIHHLKNFSKEYSNCEIYIKRDDLTGLATGGNKTRKLEYLLHQAMLDNCDAIITSGASQSNHCRQTAAACAHLGLSCHLLLGGAAPAIYDGNLLLSAQFGANIHFTGDNRKGEDAQQLQINLKKEGKKPFMIPYGGSNLTGTLGFVNAMQELKQQITEMNVEIDHIVFASSSGATQAGMILGNLLFDMQLKIMAINIDKEDINGQLMEDKIFDLVNEGLLYFNNSSILQKSDIYLNRDYDKSGYGVIGKNEKKAIKSLASSEGILLDPVYTGRAFYGLMDLLEQSFFPKDSKILFWHTGGIPALFNYKDQL